MATVVAVIVSGSLAGGPDWVQRSQAVACVGSICVYELDRYRTLGDPAELVITARGGDAIGIGEVTVRDGTTVIWSGTGRGATWGTALGPGRQRADDVRVRLPAPVPTGELTLTVASTQAMISQHGGVDDSVAAANVSFHLRHASPVRRWCGRALMLFVSALAMGLWCFVAVSLVRGLGGARMHRGRELLTRFLRCSHFDLRIAVVVNLIVLPLVVGRRIVAPLVLAHLPLWTTPWGWAVAAIWVVVPIAALWRFAWHAAPSKLPEARIQPARLRSR